MISFNEFSMQDGSPIYQQILLYIKRGVIAGTIKDGDELPSRRVLSALLGVNPNTVQKALSELEWEKLLYTMRTAGRYVTEDAALIAALREQLAGERIIKFLDELKQLGFQHEDILQLLAKHMEGEDKQ